MAVADYAARLIPDFEAGFRRTPVTMALAVLGTGVMIAFVDNELIHGFSHHLGSPAPNGALVFPVVMAAIIWAFAIERFGAARGWHRGVAGFAALIPLGLILAALALRSTAPDISAQWLPISLPLVLFAGVAFAIASGGAGRSSDAANRGIWTCLLTGLAALLAAWVFSGVVASFFGGSRSGSFGTNLYPQWQAFTFGFASVLGTAWLSAGSQSSSLGASTAPRSSIAMETALRLLVPILLILFAAMAAMTVRRLTDGNYPSTQGVPILVVPLTLILLLLVAVYCQVYGVRERGGPLLAVFARFAPVVLLLVAAALGFALFREVTGARGALTNAVPMFRPLGATHIADTIGPWIFGGFALLTLFLLLVRPAWRDLRLPWLLGGLTLLVTGFGPLSLDRLATYKLAAEVERLVTEHIHKAGGPLRPASEISWPQPQVFAVRDAVARLGGRHGIGTLKPIFRGATDDPFAAGGTQIEITDRVMRRLNVGSLPPAQPTPPSTPPQQMTNLSLQPGATGRALTLDRYDTLIGPIRIGAPFPGNWVRIEGLGNQPPANPTDPVLVRDPASQFTAEGIVVVRYANERESRFDLKPLIRELREWDVERRKDQARPRNPAVPRAPMLPLTGPRIIDAMAGSVSAKFILQNLNGTLHDERIVMLNGQGWVLATRSDVAAKP